MKVSDIRVWEKCDYCGTLTIKPVKENSDGDLFVEVGGHTCIQEE